MRILVIGSGGREHALCWAISASPLCDALFCAPGNAGIARDATCVAVNPMDPEAVIAFCRKERIDFVVVGPEAPLVAGLVDRLEAAGIPAFGPNAAAAQLEGSKGFTKDLCARHNIPTAAYGRFTEAEAAKKFIRERGAPIVVKADGLAAGKGVTVAMTLDEALQAVDDAMGGQRFGSAGAELVVEEFLDGEEASFFALVDGTHALPFGTAQDHKRVGDGDTGPNTGGMGAYSPAPCLTLELQQEVMARIVEPTVRAMAAEGHPFKGILYAGLMLTKSGPQLIEYNARLGDPECEVLLPRLKSDLLPALMASRDGVLDGFDLRWKDEAALCVILAAEGYPDAPRKGTEIKGVEKAGDLPGLTVFHAGTKREGEKLIADGGRVLAVTAAAPTIAEAQKRAYKAVDKIDWPGGFCRRDIGWRAVGKG